MTGRDGFAVVATGSAGATDPAEFSRNGPSFFVDPSGWLVAAAVTDALSRSGEPVLATPDQVGMVVLGNTATATAMRELARGAARGLVSPLRFAGANPGVLAGLPCIQWKLRGPSLTFTMDPAAGIGVAATVVGSWLRGGQANYVVVAAHWRNSGGEFARCAIVRAVRSGDATVHTGLAGLLAEPLSCPGMGMR